MIPQSTSNLFKVLYLLTRNPSSRVTGLVNMMVYSALSLRSGCLYDFTFSKSKSYTPEHLWVRNMVQ